MKLIGVIGKKNSGKSTIASILVEKFGFKEFSFADPLKQILETLFFLDPQYLQDPHLKEQIIEELRVSPRQLMQQIGSDLFRDKLAEVLPELDLQGHKFWIWHMKMRIENYINSMKNTGTCAGQEPTCAGQEPTCAGQEPLIVISDIRFVDEAEFVRNFKFAGIAHDTTIIEVCRSSLEDSNDKKTVNITDIHQSEPQLCIRTKMNADCIIENEGSLEELQTQLLMKLM